MKAIVCRYSRLKGLSASSLTNQVTTDAIVMTNRTAKLMPSAVLTLRLTPRNGQMPRNILSTKLFTRTADINISKISCNMGFSPEMLLLDIVPKRTNPMLSLAHLTIHGKVTFPATRNNITDLKIPQWSVPGKVFWNEIILWKRITLLIQSYFALNGRECPEAFRGDMDITTDEANGMIVLRLSGILDDSGADRLKAEARRIISKGQAMSVELDMADVRNANARGIVALLAVFGSLKQAGIEMYIGNTGKVVRTLLRRLKIHSVIPMRIPGKTDDKNDTSPD
jgi:anti-anti-sigma factor